MIAKTNPPVAIHLFFIVLCGACLAEAGERPRYKLKVGQQLTYRSSSEFKYEGGSHEYKKDYVIWVAAKNDDGSWRLIIRDSMQFSRGGEPRITFAYLDLAPDGSYKPNPSLGYRLDPTSIFIPLPKDDPQAESGWQGPATYDAVLQCRRNTQSEAKDGMYVIDFVRTSPMDEIYLSTSRGKVTFDTQRGVVQRIDSENTQGYGFNGKGTGQTTLESIETKPADWLSVFHNEATTYFDIAKRYDALIAKAAKSPEPEALLKRARTLAEEGKREATNKTIIDQYSDRLANHDRTAQYYVDQARRRTQVVGKPGFDFSTTDFDGKTHALKQYRGKVVILDFWYRGCGWCIRAMPQIKEVAETFASQPVQVFGMNTDRKEEDARFVIDKMQLNYPNLRAKGLPEKFQVRGFPTLIIIDQQGVVRDLHVGYSADLAEKVTNTVRKLIGEL